MRLVGTDEELIVDEVTRLLTDPDALRRDGPRREPVRRRARRRAGGRGDRALLRARTAPGGLRPAARPDRLSARRRGCRRRPCPEQAAVDRLNWSWSTSSTTMSAVVEGVVGRLAAGRSAGRAGARGSASTYGSATQHVDVGQRVGDRGDDLDRGALAHVVDVGLERQAEAGDGRVANRDALATTCSATWCGLESLTSRAVRISRASAGAAPTMNHGSTAMQWPPTPGRASGC